MLSPNQRCHYSDEAEDSRGPLLQSSNFPRGRVKVNSNGSTISPVQASPVLPEVRANGRETMKNAVPITIKPILTTRIGTSIIIAKPSGRSSGIAAEACPITNARNRQLIEKTFQRFCKTHNYWNVSIYCRSKIKLSNDWSVVGRTILFSC